MGSYLKGAGTPRVTPQTIAIPGREAEMVPNSAGGVTFAVGPLERLRRFLILGSEGGTYYATQAKLTQENATVLRATIAELGVVAVEEIARVSEAGIAPKNDPAIFALAVACGAGDPATKKAAWMAVTRVCRTGTHLFHFADFVRLRARLGPWDAPGRRRVLHGPAGEQGRVPGDQVPPA